MYNSYFGFSEKPFTIAPNPRYLYMSERHQEALAHMLYGMQGEGGVMVLTGEVGTGKTTICRRLLEQVPDNVNIAYIINPKLSSLELLATICDELQISYPEPATSIKVLTDLLNEHLLASHAKGLHTVLIIDEAQNLDSAVLEQLRLLTNLETNEQKLLQVMLLGQPELADMLQRNDLRQLAQRITARYHLTPLDRHEIAAYLNHRLTIAGNPDAGLFPRACVRLLYQHTRGVPRLINLIADRALLGAYSCESKKVTNKILKQAIREVSGESQQSSYPVVYVTALALLIAGGLFASTQWDNRSEPAPLVASVAPAMAPEPTAAPEPAVPAEETTVASDSATIPVESSRDDAFKAVFSSWHIDYQPQRDGEACAFAKQHQLLCLRQRGDIARLRNLSRPAVLTVADEEGNPAYAAITRLKGTTAIITSEQADTEVSLAQLALQSHNDFTILWRTPEGYEGPVRPGSKGKIVQLLAEKCSAAENLQWIGAPRVHYDLALKEQVKSFQRKLGLKADGVAGPLTWIHINQLTDAAIPTLREHSNKGNS